MVIHEPVSAGMSARRLRRLDEAYARRIEAGELMCAASCVARRGRVVHFHVQGMADRELGTPLAEDTIHRLFSMSKPVTAVAALTLLEEGRFQLDDPVSAYIPELGRLKVLRRLTDDGPQVEEPRRPVTVRHLFTHTAGFCYPDSRGSGAERLLASAMGSEAIICLPMDLARLMTVLASVPLACHPGEDYEYGLSIDVLGRLIEVVSGRPLDEALQERVFGPLGMADTGFFVPEGKHGRLAAVYEKDEAGGLRRMPSYTDAFNRKPLFLSGGGGLVSTAEDYLRFGLMLQNGGELDGARVLGRRTVRLMTLNHIPHLMRLPAIRSGRAFGPGYGYGLGGRVLVDERAGLWGSAGSYGWNGALGTLFFVDHAQEVAAMLLTQIDAWPPSHYEQFRTLVNQAIG
jgi:CubicO group peptidase (beta-lactamase class C family)